VAVRHPQAATVARPHPQRIRRTVREAVIPMDEWQPGDYLRSMTATPETAQTPPRITVLLRRAALGDRAALDLVYATLYPDLKRVARARLRQQGHAAALHTTTLVHESFLRLVKSRDLQLEDRHHFFAYAAKAMRHVIIDAARAQHSARRGGGAPHTTLGADDRPDIADPGVADELLQVNEALQRLEAVDPVLAEVVDMRYFGGYSEKEIADLQGVTERTVRRRWERARAWLFVALGHDGGEPIEPG